MTSSSISPAAIASRLFRRKGIAALWWLAAGLMLVILLASVPEFVAYLVEYSQDETFLRDLTGAGMTGAGYILWGLMIGYIPPIVFYLAGLILYRRKPGEPMVVFVSFTLILFISIFPPINIMTTRQPFWYWWTALLTFIGLTCMTCLFYVFPDGRFVPGWTRYAGIGLTTFILIVLPLLFNQTTLAVEGVSLFGAVLMLLWVASLIYAQVYRFRRAATPAQRQQTKWAVFGLVTVVVMLTLYIAVNHLLVALNAPELVKLVYSVIFGTTACVGTALIPLSIGFSVLRYRLWEIDFIINRTLLYGGLTGALTLAYFGSVIVFQQIALLLTGGTQSSLAIAIATLLIAALFQPFRRYLQTALDRYFDEPDEPLPPEMITSEVAAVRLQSGSIVQPFEDPLSERELEVLSLIAQGLTNQDIAARLVITEGTVKRHTTNIYGKMGVRNRTQAVAKGREMGMLP